MLLALLIEKYRGLSYADYIKEAFFAPLNLQSPFFGHTGVYASLYTVFDYSGGQPKFMKDRIDPLSETISPVVYLYGALTFQRDHTLQQRQIYDTLELQLGVIGESSGAVVVQINWHKFIGVERPNEWDNQLPDEPAFLVKFKREWPGWREWRLNDLGTHLRLRPFMEGQAGTIAVRAKAGLETRIGHNMKDDPLRGDWSADDKATWFAFINANGSAVAHNIFLDGTVFRNSASVPQKHFVAKLRYGVTLQWQRFFLTFAEIWQSKEFDGQPKGHRYSAIRLKWYY